MEITLEKLLDHERIFTKNSLKNKAEVCLETQHEISMLCTAIKRAIFFNENEIAKEIVITLFVKTLKVSNLLVLESEREKYKSVLATTYDETFSVLTKFANVVKYISLDTILRILVEHLTANKHYVRELVVLCVYFKITKSELYEQAFKEINKNMYTNINKEEE